MHRRKRRLEPGEQKLLEVAAEKCRGQNKFYVPLAIAMAVETGMRLQEIFGLTWGDINIETRRIEIRKSKTDHVQQYAGRTIVMTARAMFYFSGIMPDKPRRDEPVFPMDKDPFKQSWKDVVKRARIKGLTFHDLRREAGSRFDEAGLTKAEHDLMMGHANGDMSSIYIAADLNRIQDKLDAYERAKTLSKQRKAA
jgi:integrase